jgi:5-methylthioadenosine/S-adenosylhomocysteine deaminase
MESVDIVIQAGTMLPMTGDVISHDSMVAIKGDRIVFAGPRIDGAQKYQSGTTIGSPESVVLPGLVNAHTHVGIHFFGTLCDEGSVINALYNVLFPLEVAFDSDLMYAASSLGFWDAVKGGVTTVCDHYHFPEATAQAAHRVGCRALVADKIIEFTLDNPPRYDGSRKAYDIDYNRAEAEARLSANVGFIERWRGDSLVVPALGPHAPDTLSSEMLIECARVAESLDVKMIMHVAQGAAEIKQVQSKGYRGSVHYLDELGILSPRLQAAHMAYLTDEEVRIAASSGMNMSYNPVVMMACHSFPSLDALISSGIGMGMGTDAFSFDQLEELRYAIYMGNFVCGDNGFQLGAYELLKMATIGGARCLGLDDQIGSIEVGKKADLIVLNLRDAQLVPNTNTFETIAYRAKSRNLTHTLVDGKIVYAAGRLQLANEDEIFDEGTRLAADWLNRNTALLGKIGLNHRFDEAYRASMTSAQGGSGPARQGGTNE